jgi:sugar lactone lactonase YvrE
MRRTRFYISGTLAALLMVGAGQLALEKTAAAQGAQAPKFEVDRLWPKPLGNHWIPGSINGVTVDSTDHIWVSHRGLDSLQANEKGPTQTPWASECCFSAPMVMEFDAAGTLLSHWGGPGAGYDWPQNPSGIAVDAKGNVWIAAAGVPVTAGRGRGPAPAAADGAAAPAGRAGRAAAPAAGGAAPAARGGRGGAGGAAAGGAAPAAAAPPAARGGAPAGPPPPGDAQVLKFSKSGQFIMQIGKAGQMGTPDGTTSLNRPAAVAIDDAANEVYVADTGDNRVAVFDANTGAFKRAWGGSGDKPEAASGTYAAGAPSKQFRGPTCVKIAKDGMVYVCDKGNDRVQVFSKDGKFVKDVAIMPTSTGEGTASDVAFSADAQQRFLYVADIQDKTVVVLDRASLATVGTVGEGGRYPGMFYGLIRVAVDSKGNLYTGETYEGKRVQKFNFKGLGPAQAMK